MKKVIFYFRLHNKGQSFMELALVLSILLLLVTGMVEFGNLLNQYINLVDGVREGARFGSNNDPFFISDKNSPDYGKIDYSAPQESFFQNIDKVIEGDTSLPVSERTSAIAPIVLDPVTHGVRTPSGEPYKADDILITFYGVSGNTITGTFPSAEPWAKYPSGQVSKITDGDIRGYLEPGAPATGILVVEIFYNYHQLLKLPLFTTVISDPIPVHSYAVMPLSGAEATPGP
jgi:hypothetical protein